MTSYNINTMLQLGEIKHAQEIGYKGTDNYIWYACTDCAKERWVRLKRNKPISLRCPVCSMHLHRQVLNKRQSECRGTIADPEIGDIRRADELSKKHRGVYYIYLACIDCNKGRWVELHNKNKAQNRRCCSCARKNDYKWVSPKGDKSISWKGGRVKAHGYIRIYTPNHPRASGNYIYEHLLVWEEAHGKQLPDGWQIHHLNGIKDDNRPENLAALPTRQHRLVIKEMRHRIRQLESQIKVLRQSTQGKLVEL